LAEPELPPEVPKPLEKVATILNIPPHSWYHYYPTTLLEAMNNTTSATVAPEDMMAVNNEDRAYGTGLLSTLS